MLLGWPVTFGWLWRKRGEKSPTEWARFPAMVGTIIAAIPLVVGSLTTYGLTIALVVGGLVLIYIGVRQRNDIQVN